MQTSTPPVRTHRTFHDEETFQELIAERLRQSPWLLLSAAAHAVLLLLVWVLLPGERKRPPEVQVTVQHNEQHELVEPPPPPPPVTKPEDVQNDPVVSDVVVTDTPAETESFDDLATNTKSAFEFTGDNAAVGLGNNAGGPYGSRGGGGRGPGGHPTPVTVERGLQWLAAHQDPDGRWDADGFMKHDDARMPICDGPGNGAHDVGVTGLALLAFLGENHTMRAGKYRDVVRKGVLWLKDQQQPNGQFGTPSSHDFIYDHAIAAYAMCEAYGLSDYRLLRQSAQRGIEYLEAHRNPYGAWRYQPRDQDNDLSVTGWAIMAYKSGKYFDLVVNDQAFADVTAFMDQVSDASGLHGYQRAGQLSSRKRGDHEARFPAAKTHALTAVGLFARFFVGQDPREHEIMNASADLLLELPPRWDEASGVIDHYYWYYGTYALFQMGGTRWTRWQKAVERAAADHQHKDTGNQNLLGSWDPVGAWGTDGGRVYSTAILTLTMQATYRYSRLVR